MNCTDRSSVTAVPASITPRRANGALGERIGIPIITLVVLSLRKLQIAGLQRAVVGVALRGRHLRVLQAEADASPQQAQRGLRQTDPPRSTHGHYSLASSVRSILTTWTNPPRGGPSPAPFRPKAQRNY